MVSQFSKAFLGNQFSAIYFSLRLHPVGSDTDELSGIEKIHEKSIVVLERVKIGFYLLFFRGISLPIIMSLDRAMTHRPAATGPPFGPSRQFRREVDTEACTFPGANVRPSGMERGSPVKTDGTTPFGRLLGK